MGACLSCLRGRDNKKEPAQGRGGESQPLLDDSNDMYGSQYGSEGQADQLAQRRQQELSQIVQATHEYFIDVSSMRQPELPESQGDVSGLRDRIEQRAAGFRPQLPALRDLTPEERDLLQEGLAGIEHR